MIEVHGPLSLATLVVLVALLAVDVARLRSRRGVGRVLVRQRALGPLRSGLLGALVALVLLAFGLDPDLGLRALLPLTGAALLLVRQPWPDDELVGEGGVARGWTGRRYEDLEEWRLTGDHLRFRAGGEWLAVQVPKELRADLRARLEQAVPERESPFAR